ncbi:hypothetical protein FRC05_011296 [Tulasnella sp. 425]|nr:hypothetical protein FRC05_011296 [Tulasnella sp. 425]
MGLPSSCPICVDTGVVHPVSATGSPSESQVPPVSQSSSSVPVAAFRQEGSPTSRHSKRSRRGGHRISSPITRGGSPADAPIAGHGFDLAAELERAENKDILEGKTEPAGQINTSAQAVDYGEVQEVKALRDANKALSLYASKVIDRVIAQEGSEQVLAVDHEPSKEDNPPPSGSPIANSSTPNVSTESAAGKPTRRALSMDRKGLTNLFGASPFGVETDDLLPQGREQQFRMNPETTLVKNDNTGTRSVYDG